MAKYIYKHEPHKSSNTFTITRVEANDDTRYVKVHYSTDTGIGSSLIDMEQDNLTEQVKVLARKITSNEKIEPVINPVFFSHPVPPSLPMWTCSGCRENISSHEPIYIHDSQSYCLGCRRSEKDPKHYVWATTSGHVVLLDGQKKSTCISYTLYRRARDSSFVTKLVSGVFKLNEG